MILLPASVTHHLQHLRAMQYEREPGPFRERALVVVIHVRFGHDLQGSRVGCGLVTHGGFMAVNVTKGRSTVDFASVEITSLARGAVENDPHSRTRSRNRQRHGVLRTGWAKA